MSKRNQDGSPRKIRRDAKLKALGHEQRKQVAEWCEQAGWQVCLQRIALQLGIQTTRSKLYEALAFWRTEEQFASFRALARAQAELEAAEKGGLSPEQMEEAVDRHFLGLATLKQDPKLYQDIRYLRVADQSAKANARIAEAKLKQGDAKIAQKNADLALAERRVALLEAKARQALETVEDGKLSDAEKAARIREIFKR